jgi:hypothetical protein
VRRRGHAIAIAALLAACGRSGEDEKKPAGEKPPPVAASAPRADAAPAADPSLPRYWVEPSAAAGLARMLEQVKPRVLGVGEVHLAGRPKVRSALSRFTEDMLAGLDGRATDLRSTGGAEAPAPGREAGDRRRRATTERPPETERDRPPAGRARGAPSGRTS